MKKISYAYLIIIFTLTSCKQEKNILSPEVISRLSNVDFQMPSRYTNLKIFVLSKNDSLIVTNNDNLYYAYSSQFKRKYEDYEDFLSSVVNQKIVLDRKDFGNAFIDKFKIDKNVENEYHKIGFEKFFQKYTVKDKSNKQSFNLISEDEHQVMTIIYFFYLNGYDTSSNDYLPKLIVRKRTI